MSAPLVVVAGALANKPGNGGEAWVRLSWVRALSELGCDVHLVEELATPGPAPGPGDAADAATSAAVAYFRDVVGWSGLSACSTLVTDHECTVTGLPPADLRELLGACDLLVNISGNLSTANLLRAARRRAYVDLDPGFTQAWHRDGLLGTALLDHHLHATVGANVGRRECTVPTGGFRWLPVRQPVLMDDWDVKPVAEPDRFTTIGRWRPPYGRIRVAGRDLGLKVHEFRRFAELPSRSRHRFEAVLAIDAADIGDASMLSALGWELHDPSEVAHPETFRDFITASSAEWSVAQGAYVDTNSGWCSDRTVRYLAAGRPALVQDTGQATTLPLGDGLLTFQDLDGAVAAADRIVADHAHHAEAARELAHERFTPAAAIGSFLDAGLSS